MFNDKAKYQHFAIFSCLKRHKKTWAIYFAYAIWSFLALDGRHSSGCRAGGKPQAQAELDDFFQFPNYRKTRIKSGRPLPKGRKQHNISAWM